MLSLGGRDGREGRESILAGKDEDEGRWSVSSGEEGGAGRAFEKRERPAEGLGDPRADEVSIICMYRMRVQRGYVCCAPQNAPFWATICGRSTKCTPYLML